MLCLTHGLIDRLAVGCVDRGFYASGDGDAIEACRTPERDNKRQYAIYLDLYTICYRIISDIHGYTIRYRIEGALTMSETMPCNWWKIFCGKATRRTNQGN